MDATNGALRHRSWFQGFGIFDTEGYGVFMLSFETHEITLLAGDLRHWGSKDGVGQLARFWHLKRPVVNDRYLFMRTEGPAIYQWRQCRLDLKTLEVNSVIFEGVDHNGLLTYCASEREVYVVQYVGQGAQLLVASLEEDHEVQLAHQQFTGIDLAEPVSSRDWASIRSHLDIEWLTEHSDCQQGRDGDQVAFRHKGFIAELPEGKTTDGQGRPIQVGMQMDSNIDQKTKELAKIPGPLAYNTRAGFLPYDTAVLYEVELVSVTRGWVTGVRWHCADRSATVENGIFEGTCQRRQLALGLGPGLPFGHGGCRSLFPAVLGEEDASGTAPQRSSSPVRRRAGPGELPGLDISTGDLALGGLLLAFCAAYLPEALGFNGAAYKVGGFRYFINRGHEAFSEAVHQLAVEYPGYKDDTIFTYFDTFEETLPQLGSAKRHVRLLDREVTNIYDHKRGLEERLRASGCNGPDGPFPETYFSAEEALEAIRAIRAIDS
eukprot:g22857.t1